MKFFMKGLSSKCAMEFGAV